MTKQNGAYSEVLLKTHLDNDVHPSSRFCCNLHGLHRQDIISDHLDFSGRNLFKAIQTVHAICLCGRYGTKSLN